MEGPYAQSVSRLRLSRQPLASVADRHVSQEDHTTAGPSRPRDSPASDLLGDAASDEDHQPTPRGNPNSSLPSSSDAAERLRALMSRMPNQSKTPTARPASPSEVESDFDPPRFSPTQPSFGKESLKDLFSRVLEDTPIKRTRRGSTSEVEDSPRVEGSVKFKGKRKSLSDEETEKLSQPSGSSFRSSQAVTFDNLRERLANSHTSLKNQAAPSGLYDTSNADNTTDTATFLRDLNSSRATPPVATSTPPHSMEISTDSRFQTNLMNDDSEMHHMIKNLVSYEGDSGPSPPVSFPSSRGRSVRPGPSHGHVGTPQSHRLSYNGIHPVSRVRTHSGSDSTHDSTEHLHEPETEWKRSHSHVEKSHSNHTNGRSNSPTVIMNGHTRVRTRSENSTSSRGSSMNSQSDCKYAFSWIHSSSFMSPTDKERVLEAEKERNLEREHGWNKPKGARSTSALNVHSHSGVHSPERTRKLSQPTRPGSSQSIHPPRSLSATSSRTSSDEEEEELVHEIEHERERNWNAPVQRWSHHTLPPHSHSHARSTSPMPPSPSISASSDLHSTARIRANSLRLRGTPKGDSPVHRHEQASPIASSSKTTNDTPASHQARPRYLMGTNSRPRPVSYPARPNSPLPPFEGKSKPATSGPASSTQKPSPQPRSPEREYGHSKMPSSPTPSQGKRPVNPIRTSNSHIPIRSRSPVKIQNKEPISANRHSRMPAESQSVDTQSLLQVPGSPATEESGDESTFGGNEHPPKDKTSVTTSLVEISTRHSPSPPPQPVKNTRDEELFRKAVSVAPPPSPPPSPPTPPTTSVPPPQPEATNTTILSLLSTPPKRPSFHSSKLDFQTPSPPRGLPDLPGPPSSSDEETETERPANTPLRSNGAPNTTLKTPRPPGAWASTPSPLVRSNSLSASEHGDGDSQYEGGLATPIPSLSRASSLPAQTPKPPGGWVATPTPRKSVRQVTFDLQPSEFELSATEESTNDHPEEQSQVSEAGLATPVEVEQLRSHIQEPTSPSKSPRRSPTVRIVDAYGRPDKSKAMKSPKSRNKNAVRIVDAMGREVEPAEQTAKDESCDDMPLDRIGALRVVREGVSDLAHKLNELDLSSDFVQLDEDRIRELDNTSRAARETREDLKQAYTQLRASMQRSKVAVETNSRSPSPRIRLWTFIILCQALFIYLIYRFQKRSTRELFLTTYYDPFYPDLHLYGIKYDYLTFPHTPPSITSLSNTLRQEGFKAFIGSLVDTAALILADWRADTWRRWGAEDIQSVRWPPT
ncbi:hypothetical protein GGX14DRAFT_452266 [Mycena pura]|uniref:Uncharacterized protein n=1 Tax=Mycena pura TaxID=153505 RepID=A0AAD6YEX7_9AGAR|nr:hypothetical protein GGX14DRAFT_452266 [Mycena pura]